jgi:hypothetical protein
VPNPEIPPLTEAPLEVQLAVELILLLEQQDLPAEQVLTALTIVQNDFRKKLQLPRSEAG